jgi:hypothetical protein
MALKDVPDMAKQINGLLARLPEVVERRVIG